MKKIILLSAFMSSVSWGTPGDNPPREIFITISVNAANGASKCLSNTDEGLKLLPCQPNDDTVPGQIWRVAKLGSSTGGENTAFYLMSENEYLISKSQKSYLVFTKDAKLAPYFLEDNSINLDAAVLKVSDLTDNQDGTLSSLEIIGTNLNNVVLYYGSPITRSFCLVSDKADNSVHMITPFESMQKSCLKLNISVVNK